MSETWRENAWSLSLFCLHFESSLICLPPCSKWVLLCLVLGRRVWYFTGFCPYASISWRLNRAGSLTWKAVNDLLLFSGWFFFLKEIWSGPVLQEKRFIALLGERVNLQSGLGVGNQGVLVGWVSDSLACWPPKILGCVPALLWFDSTVSFCTQGFSEPLNVCPALVLRGLNFISSALRMG